MVAVAFGRPFAKMTAVSYNGVRRVHLTWP